MSLKAAAQYLADHGRHGDTMLVHMTKEEVQGLQQLAEMHGLSLTINPHTGLPEAFSLKSLLKAVAPIALGAFLGPGAFGITGMGLSAGTAGLITGGVTTALTGSLEKGIMAGLGAYGGAGMAEGAKSLGEASLSAADQSAAETARLLGKEAAAQGASAVPSELSSQFAQAYAPGTTQSAAETSRLLGREAIAAAPEEAMKNIAARNASEFAVANSNVVSPFTTEQAVQEGLRHAVKDPSALYKAMGPDAMKYTAAAGLPAAQELSKTKMPDSPLYPPSAAIRPKYAYRDEQGNVQFVDLPGVKMADWKPEQGISEYVQSLIAEPTYANEIKRAAQGGLMDDQELAYQNDPVVRMAAGGVSDADVQKWFASNAGATDAQIAQAIDQFKVSPEQVSRVTGVGLPQVQQRYEAAIAPQIVSGYTEGVAGPGGTTATPGSGYLGIYDDLTQRGITASELFNAPGYKGWSQPAISHAYDVASAINTFDPRTDTVIPSDREWVTFMDANKFSVADIAQATGLSQAEVQRRYDAAKNVSPVILDAGTSTGVTGGTYGNGAEAPYGSGPATGIDYLGRTTSIATPGDKIYNPDDSVSVVPNVPGRPYGGFTGMDAVKSAYTAGGGNLGQVLKPTKTYQNTGLSAAAYDYLFGKGPLPMYTQKSAVPADTFSNFTSPTDDEVLAYTGKYYVWKNGKMVKNPWFGKTSAKAEEKKTTTTTTTEEVKPAKGGLLAHYAEGGLSAAYAAGGMSGGGYDLGGYSDGGRLLRGPGDGVSDSIPATIGGKRPARLADGEFVVPARIVSEIGNGSTEAGARKLYAMMERVQQARKQTVGKGRSKVAKNTRADKYLPV